MGTKHEQSRERRRQPVQYRVDPSPLKILREERHQSQVEVAAGIKIHPNTWVRKETGKHQLSLDEFADLCTYWQISPERLISYLVKAG